ncbi:SGNH/GDSL hydrolase family protein [Ruania zhangjianzhongii]|uniref:SGNH/GDSL hydrolase family protein n=1 Tax=Ruania zhangjianzhongii TaxID=2603206 RepID=UPI0022A829B5|nr:SGNH/GDSL hydrolase family protein [Ruania zhangjianzhongii]
MSVSWHRYIAVGDSMTEGLWDPYAEEGEQLRGWADRLAAALSARRVADGGARLEYANLAVRGRLLGPILDVQLPEALAAGPDLVSIVGGGNDLLRPNADPDRLAVRLERAVRSARAAGAQVLLATGTDPRRAPLLGAIRPKVAVYNAHIWSIARRTGADVVDVWGLRALQDWRMWAQDRIHLSPEGHHRVAQAALVALGLPPEDPDWARPLPAAEPIPVRDQWRTDAAWLRREVYPWARRHLRGRSSGDGRSAKRPDAAPLAAMEPDGSAGADERAGPDGSAEHGGSADGAGPTNGVGDDG